MSISGKKERELLRLRRSLFRAEQALSELDRVVLSDKGLCKSDLEILERLANKGPCPVNTLAPRIGLTSGSMTTAVQRLLKRKLVRTVRDAQDKRIVHVHITEEGQEFAEQALAEWAGAINRVFEDWTKREQTVLSAFMKRLRKDAKKSTDHSLFFRD